MLLLRAAALAVAASLLSSAGVFAQVESTPIPMSPKPDFSKLSYMSGNVRCSVKSSRRPSAYITTSTSNVSSDGYWMTVRSTTHKASWIPRELTSVDRVTYDPSTSRWVDINTDDEGGYNVSTSPGWRGNTITWTDAVITKANATASTSPTVVTKVNDSRSTAKSSFREPSGRMVTVSTVCTKS